MASANQGLVKKGCYNTVPNDFEKLVKEALNSGADSKAAVKGALATISATGGKMPDGDTIKYWEGLSTPKLSKERLEKKYYGKGVERHCKFIMNKILHTKDAAKKGVNLEQRCYGITTPLKYQDFHELHAVIDEIQKTSGELLTPKIK